MEETDKVSRHRHLQTNENGFLNALLLFVIGILLLLNNFGVIDWNIWNSLWKFWPVILIIWGLKEISEDSIFLRLIAGILGIIIIAFVITYSLAQTDPDFKLWLEEKYPIWNKILKVAPKEVVRRSFA